jgi:hypothetical protein
MLWSDLTPYDRRETHSTSKGRAVVSGTVERAFEIAPDCTSMDEIRSRLRKEGHHAVDEHLQGGSIKKQLKLTLGKNVR